MEALPLNYWEPISLFYWEEQSISAVASALGISEDVVKQRLSRGRKLLREEVNQILEVGLAETKPDCIFTASVVTALPSMTGVGGATAVAGTAGGKAGGLFGASYVMLSSLASEAVSILGLYVLVQYIKNVRWSLQFRKVFIQGLISQVVATSVFCSLFGFALVWAHRNIGSSLEIPALVFMGLAGFWEMAILFLAWRSFQKLKHLERTSPMVHWESPHVLSCYWESGIRLLGMPLISVATGQGIKQGGTKFGRAKGWIPLVILRLGVCLPWEALLLHPFHWEVLLAGFYRLEVCLWGFLHWEPLPLVFWV